MKSLVVFSDSHNQPLSYAFYEIAKSADYVIFLGDGLSALKDFAALDNFYFVKGNCDFMPAEKELTLDIEGIRVFMCHGDNYIVKRDLTRLFFAAQEKKAHIVLFGHTHESLDESSNGVRFINPGSTSSPRFGERSYAYITITDGKILSKLVPLH